MASDDQIRSWANARQLVKRGIKPRHRRSTSTSTNKVRPEAFQLSGLKNREAKGFPLIGERPVRTGPAHRLGQCPKRWNVHSATP